MFVFSVGDVDPGTWYVIDTHAMSMKKVASAKPEIDPGRMLHKQIVSYPSLDGLSIPAYLTLPRDARSALPAVLLIHGGPVARDDWFWDPVVQMLASRGYAVLQPQFRGSAGFGDKFEEAGYGQWGLAMQDDVTAGAQWPVSEGLADPSRLCIYGGSYGGYAAMWGLAKTPDLFRCGISFAGVSDLSFMAKDDSDVNDHAIGRLIRRKIVGDPEANRQRFDEVSPPKKAAAIKAPVLIAHGDRDTRVPIENSEKLVDALRENHNQVEWMKLRDEVTASPGQRTSSASSRWSSTSWTSTSGRRHGDSVPQVRSTRHAKQPRRALCR
ncbi:MAG TPA: alpha/beta fold hydrolase [Caldimonas sp.]